MSSLLAMEEEEARHVPAKLIELISKENADEIGDLIKEESFSSQELTNALALAVKKNSKIATAALLHAGVPVNQLTTIVWPPMTQTPPLYIAAFLRNPLLVEWLLIFGADPNLKLPLPESSYDAIYNCNRTKAVSHSPFELAKGWSQKGRDKEEAEKEAAIQQLLLQIPREHFQNPELKKNIK